ncbi:MAG: cysteine synthase A [Anaerovoracaceae bacterium]|nr:cysteine synthase A [Anaerovoracaceae bacterium]
MIAKSIVEAIGRTPLMRLDRYTEAKNIECTNFFGKLEALNPTGSVKARAAAYMLDKAREEGLLNDGGTVVEPTSGNTGIALAAMARAMGYKAMMVMPESMSMERRSMITAYGAELVLTPASEGMQGTLDKTKQLLEEMNSKEKGSAYSPGQFDNPANALAHYETTGPEIWEDLEGKVDIFIAGFGTAGTVSGAGKFLKEKNPDVKIVAVEPSGSPLVSEGKAGPHKIQGIGANFIPGLLTDEVRNNIIDEVITVGNEESVEAAGILAKTEGYLAGISSGAALVAAERVALREENKDKNIVVILPDGGDRYMSMGIYD